MGTPKIIKIQPNEKYLDITWNVSNFCNFKCSYCNPGNYEGSFRNDSNLEVYIKNLKSITDKYLNLGYKNFKFFFSGGEPTLWKNLIPIIEWTKDNLPNVVIAINTNFSRPLSWWKKYGHLFDDVVASYHIEFSDQKKYLENAMYMYNKLNYFSCKMLMHEEKFWEVVEFGNLLKEKLPNYFIEWTPLFDEINRDAKPWEYSDKKKVEFLQKHSVDQRTLEPKKHIENPFYSEIYWDNDQVTPGYSNEVIIKRQNFFKGWECSVGDAIWINQLGEITMATCGQVDKLGNMTTDVTEVGPKKITCQKEHCVCGTDILIPKTIKIYKKTKNEKKTAAS